MTMRMSGHDLELHETHGEWRVEVKAIPPVFRRAKGDHIKLLYHFGLIILFRVDHNTLGVDTVETVSKPLHSGGPI
jgi:hypothetical protein